MLIRALHRITYTSAILLFSFLLKAQEPYSKSFDFEYTWGIYEHFMVSSKFEKVYVKIQHPDVYQGIKIESTSEDKQQVWKELNKINFFSYPDKYSPQAPKDTLPEFEVIYAPQIDSTEIINIPDGYEYIFPENDTIWKLPKIYELVETIPYLEYSITVYFLGKKKTVRWQGDRTLREMGSKKEIIDPRFENLYKVGGLIYNITKKKKGYRNLPKSDLRYY